MPSQPLVGRRSLFRAAADPVDAAVVLATDCSGSIDNENLALQFRGYAEAITSDLFIRTVQSGLTGRIALTFVGWSDALRQNQMVPWLVIDGPSAARRFTSQLAEATFLTPGFTSISGAIDFSRKLLLGCRYPTTRRIIDVSGDGRNNDGRPVTDARDEAVAAGLRINGLPIVSRDAQISEDYAQNVIGGPSAFVRPVKDLASFRTAVLDKLVTEVAMDTGRPRRFA